MFWRFSTPTSVNEVSLSGAVVDGELFEAVRLAVDGLECGRACEVERNEVVACDIECLDDRHVSDRELGQTVVVDAEFCQLGTSGEVDRSGFVARSVDFGDGGSLGDSYRCDGVARHIDRGQSCETVEFEITGKFFILPVDFGDVAVLDSDAFPCRRVFEVSDFERFGVGCSVLCGSGEESLKLFQLILVDVLGENCKTTECYSNQ